MPLALQAAAADASVVSRFHFYAGCCTWFPQQLQTEMAQGYWVPIRAPSDVLIRLQRQWAVAQQEHEEQQQQQGQQGQDNDVTPTAAAAVAGAGVPPAAPLTQAQFQALQARTATWPLLLSLLPDAYQHCAALPLWLHAGTVEAMDWK
jgi:hypothetical protein